MMYCKNCGNRLFDSDLFCSTCGARIVRRDTFGSTDKIDSDRLDIYATYLSKMRQAYKIMLIIGVCQVIAGIPLLGVFGYGLLCMLLGIWNISYSTKQQKFLAGIPQKPERIRILLQEEGYGVEQLRRILNIIFGAGIGIILAVVYKEALDYGVKNSNAIIYTQDMLLRKK